MVCPQITISVYRRSELSATQVLNTDHDYRLPMKRYRTPDEKQKRNPGLGFLLGEGAF